MPNAVQIVLVWNQASGKTAHNVLYGRAGGVPAPTVAQAQAIFSALSSGAQWTALSGFLHSATAFAAVTIRSVHAAFQPMVQSTGAAVIGTGAGQGLPNEVALCVTLRTALTGPQNRGRFYIPGFDTTGLAAGNVASATLVTAAQNWANTISGAFSAQGYTWVIGQPHRLAYTGSTGTQHPERLATSQVVTSSPVRDNHWDSQRRRGLK